MKPFNTYVNITRQTVMEYNFYNKARVGKKYTNDEETNYSSSTVQEVL